ncbi:MAG: hypothetical protein R3199_02930 [Gemmatimonadota bacterium]|nr:hypothetical protein [Gemmatimonadota bacterium]
MRHPPERAAKFRQAAIVYLHYGLLYWMGAWALWERGLFPSARGPEWAWFAAGAAIALAVTAALWWWQNVWFARVLWALVALRLPTLIEGAFLEGGAARISPGLYLAAGLVVLAVLWALARAAWDV